MSDLDYINWLWKCFKMMVQCRWLMKYNCFNRFNKSEYVFCMICFFGHQKQAIISNSKFIYNIHLSMEWKKDKLQSKRKPLNYMGMAINKIKWLKEGFILFSYQTCVHSCVSLYHKHWNLNCQKINSRNATLYLKLINSFFNRLWVSHSIRSKEFNVIRRLL